MRIRVVVGTNDESFPTTTRIRTHSLTRMIYGLNNAIAGFATPLQLKSV